MEAIMKADAELLPSSTRPHATTLSSVVREGGGPAWVAP